jgi:hypothetical protein
MGALAASLPPLGTGWIVVADSAFHSNLAGDQELIVTARPLRRLGEGPQAVDSPHIRQVWLDKNFASSPARSRADEAAGG